MRTERFWRILEAAGSADPKWFASEKQHIENKSVGSTSGVRAVPTHATASSAGIGGRRRGQGGLQAWMN